MTHNKTNLTTENTDHHLLPHSWKLYRLTNLSTFLGSSIHWVSVHRNGSFSCVLGWGHKPTADKARRYAAQHNLPYIALEDGFLRSLGLGCKGAQPLSLVVDHTGIY